MSENERNLGHIDPHTPLDIIKEIKNAPPKILKIFEEWVIETKHPEYNYLFARFIEGADIKRHGEALIESKDPQYNYYFARDVKGADIKAHGKVVIESDNPDYNLFFADIEGADKEAHLEIYRRWENEWHRKYGTQNIGRQM